jgi:pimeloyl-ACP methyl ester carboxylesterase
MVAVPPGHAKVACDSLVEMRVVVSGEGPPVVKIAGLVGGVGLYREEVRAARAAGFRVAELDTTGDRRDDPAPGPITWDGLAHDVRLAVERIDAGPAILWGTSFGGLVALAAAVRHPEHVAGLLLSFPPHPDWRPRLWIGLYGWACRRSRPAAATTRLFQLGFSVLNVWEFVAFPTALARLPSLARAGREAATPARTIHEKIGLLWSVHPGTIDPAREIPATVICGRCDTIVPFEQARRVSALIPGARLRVIRLAGHAGAYSRPRTYGRIAIEELSLLAARAGVAGPTALGGRRS